MRARLKMVERHTSVTNSIHLLLDKHNIDSPDQLEGISRYQYEQLSELETLLSKQILSLEKQLHPILIPDDDIQRLLWIPGIGKLNAFTILLEVDDIKRFEDIKHFFSYCRLSPAAQNSGGKSRQRCSKDGNRYLKLTFSNAAIHAIMYYPVIRNYYHSLLRRKNKPVARTIIAKEIAEITLNVLKLKNDFNDKFKGHFIPRKSLQWPRVVSPSY